MKTTEITTDCCIAGGGPAGMMLGVLLARAGIGTVVLEKHADFLRDFRGDTVHPSTLELMHELGWLGKFLQHPHQKMRTLSGKIEDTELTVADFSNLKVAAPYIAFMPQWDFLNFLAEEGKHYPKFRLIMQAKATDLIMANGEVVGLAAETPEGRLHIKSKLVVAADGRHSVLRPRAGLTVEDYGAPMDVFWFRLSRSKEDSDETIGRFMAGKIMVLINRQDYWQCGYVIPKGTASQMRKDDIALFRRDLTQAAPFLSDRVSEIRNWDDVKLLTVQVNRVQKWWRKGFLCIGDAAHAMSPIGGVGINLAVQDAVAAANILIGPLRSRKLKDQHLQAVQKRREFPTRMTQRMQFLIQNTVIKNVLEKEGKLELPLAIKALQRWPVLARIPGRLIGMGFRPEHIRKG